MKILEKIFSLTREQNQKVLTILGLKIELLNKKEKIKYLDWMLEKNSQKVSDNFVPITDKPINTENIKTKLIAFYLPQFHSIPLNDESFGKGFTEWTNVTKAIPHFIGHNQPHLPYDVGFYDLSKPDVMYRQIELAKMYGIYGFCFHYYWFSGKRLLEKPIFNYLENKDLDLPFCFCWANENWAKLWDGGDKEVIMEQEYKKEDTEKFFYDILPFFKDKRYVKIDNKPVLIIYRSEVIPQDILSYFITKMQKLAVENGFNGVFTIAAKTFNQMQNAFDYGFDAEVEFPPFKMNKILRYTPSKKYIDKNAKVRIFNMEKWIKNKYYIHETNNKLFKTVFPNWDNTARKIYSEANILQTTPDLYRAWLLGCIKWTQTHHSEQEQFVFINAWNEWGEGAHLEPDQRYGYAYLEATKAALEESVK